MLTDDICCQFLSVTEYQDWQVLMKRHQKARWKLQHYQYLCCPSLCSVKDSFWQYEAFRWWIILTRKSFGGVSLQPLLNVYFYQVGNWCRAVTNLMCNMPLVWALPRWRRKCYNTGIWGVSYCAVYAHLKYLSVEHKWLGVYKWQRPEEEQQQQYANDHFSIPVQPQLSLRRDLKTGQTFSTCHAQSKCYFSSFFLTDI